MFSQDTGSISWPLFHAFPVGKCFSCFDRTADLRQAPAYDFLVARTILLKKKNQLI